MSVSDGFVESILESPIGVALLARLESRVRQADGPFPVTDTVLDGVLAAVDAVADMSFGELVELAVLVGVLDVGPWIPDAATTAASSYRHAEARAPIAEAIDAHFGDALHAPVNRDAQQWWMDGNPHRDRLPPLFRNFEEVYGAGQFTDAGLWTVTDPPEVAHAELIDAWELEVGPVSRWRLPVLTETRVFEVHRPEDWSQLVTEHPRVAASNFECWELPSENQRAAEVTALIAVPGQRAARTHMRHHLVPDWRSVADSYDAVHLSWAGFITTEGCVTDLGGGDVALLRYWFSERTHWLADVFGEPEPAPAPWMADSLLVDDTTIDAIDIRAHGQRRRDDARILGRLLGR